MIAFVKLITSDYYGFLVSGDSSNKYPLMVNQCRSEKQEQQIKTNPIARPKRRCEMGSGGLSGVHVWVMGAGRRSS